MFVHAPSLQKIARKIRERKKYGDVSSYEILTHRHMVLISGLIPAYFGPQRAILREMRVLGACTVSTYTPRPRADPSSVSSLPVAEAVATA